MDTKYCPHCANRLEVQQRNDRKRLYCSQCRKTHYSNPTVGVAVILVENSELLLVKRLGSYADMWCIPCGHLEWGEDVRYAANREFQEETGLLVKVGPVFAVRSNFHDPEQLTVGIWFWGTRTGGELKAGSDAAEARFFHIDQLPTEMAFPTDIDVCEKLRRWIRKGYIGKIL